MDEQLREVRLVAAVSGEASSARRQPILDRADVVGLDKEHVERIAAALVKTAHRKIGIGYLRNLDSVEALGRIEQRQRSNIAEVFALDRAKLRRVQPEDACV